MFKYHQTPFPCKLKEQASIIARLQMVTDLCQIFHTQARLLQKYLQGFDELGTFSIRVNMMSSTSHLNLVGVAWPVCLLKLKSALRDLCSCEILEVSAQDPDVVNSIIMIVDRSDDTLIDQYMQGDVYRLSIQKGA